MQNKDGLPTAGVTLETICTPKDYSVQQLTQALAVAELIAPNPLVLAIAPPHDCWEHLDEHDVCDRCHRLYLD